VIVAEAEKLALGLRNGTARPDDLSALLWCLLDGGVLAAAASALGEDIGPAPLLVDTREQDPFVPYLWRNGKREPLEASVATLKEGDYTTPDAEAHVRIERKSIPDLYGTLFGGTTNALGEGASNQDRFRAELARLGAYARKYIVVEGDASDLVRYIIEHKRRVSPAGTVQMIESLSLDYGVPIRWCSSWLKGQWSPRHARDRAEWFVGFALSRIHSQATDTKEAKKAAKRGLKLPWAKETI
jgi:hypothetical protein